MEYLAIMCPVSIYGTHVKIIINFVTGATTPKLKDLNHHITPQYAADWKVIGTLLGLPSGELKAIVAGWPTKSKRCCNQMLGLWLEIDSAASWQKLFTVIESPAVSKMSNNISDEEMFKKLYYQAKHNLGTEELQLYKLIIFGPPGIGKSSLFKVLLGNNPDPLCNSTGVLYRKLVQAKVSIATLDGQSKSSWHLINIEDKVLRFCSTIERVIEKPKQVNLLPAVDVATHSDRSKMILE